MNTWKPCNTIFFTLLLYPNEDHSCCKKCVVIEEGPPKQFFDDQTIHNNEGNFPAKEAVKIEGVLFHAGNRNKDINLYQNQLLTVNHDDDPALENAWNFQVLFSS